MTTTKIHLLCLGLALGFCLQAPAQLSPGNPLAGLEKLKDFEAMRASSSDPDWRNGNDDSRPIEPGGTLVLADLKGPGMIVHFWNTIAHQAPFYSRLMTLRIYWDGENHPSVECPIGDFFGVGHGLDKPFVSLPDQGLVRRAGPELLLAHALPQVGPHHRDQRERQAVPRVLLLPGLAEVQVAAQGHRLLPRHVSAGVSLRDGPQLPDRRPRGPRTLRRHRAERGEHVRRLVWRGRRLLLH